MNVMNPDMYIVKSANTERYRKSTIPFLQRQLNLENIKRKVELKKLQLVDDSKRKCYSWFFFFMRVNYVRFLAITLENKAYFTLLYFTDMLATEVLVTEILATDFEM